MTERRWISVEELFGDMEVHETDRVAKEFEAARRADAPRSSSAAGVGHADPDAPERNRERS